jgi:hypothetical protein
MDIIPISYKNFNLQNIKIVRDKILYNNEDLYFSTPTLKITDIVDIDNKTYLQLKLTKKTNCNLFINNILATELIVRNTVSDNSLYLNSQILKDIMDNIYIKVKINDSLNSIFDKKKNPVSYNTISVGYQVKCIIKMTNFYKDITNSKFGYSFELYQLMILE